LRNQMKHHPIPSSVTYIQLESWLDGNSQLVFPNELFYAVFVVQCMTNSYA